MKLWYVQQLMHVNIWSENGVDDFPLGVCGYTHQKPTFYKAQCDISLLRLHRDDTSVAPFINTV